MVSDHWMGPRTSLTERSDLTAEAIDSDRMTRGMSSRRSSTSGAEACRAPPSILAALWEMPRRAIAARHASRGRAISAQMAAVLTAIASRGELDSQDLLDGAPGLGLLR